MIDDAILTRASTRGTTFGEYLVVVACDQQVGDSVSSSNFDFAVMASQYNTVRWFHECHAYAVVRNVDGATRSRRPLRLVPSATAHVARLSKLNV